MSRFKHTESWNRGQEVEKEFSALLKNRDPNFQKSSKDQQFQHIDYLTNFGKIDVKAKKRISRSDTEEQEEFIWLEFNNVQGKKGWLFGAADIIAFERNKDFILIKRKDLAEYAKKKCDIKNIVDKSSKALYKGYQRKGRKDLISLIKMKDLFEIKHRIWTK